MADVFEKVRYEPRVVVLKVLDCALVDSGEGVPLFDGIYHVLLKLQRRRVSALLLLSGTDGKTPTKTFPLAVFRRLGKHKRHEFLLD